MLGAVVQHYNVRHVRPSLLITADDIPSEDPAANGSGSNDADTNKQIHDVAGMFRKKTKWISGMLHFPFFVFLFLSIIAPIFERTVDGVLPMIMSAFGNITVPDPEICFPSWLNEKGMQSIL